jgi:hypothetical protein
MNDRTPHPVFRRATIVAVAAVLSLGACGKKESTPDPTTKSASEQASKATAAENEIKIVAVKPEVEAFKAGETVRLALSASYKLPAQGGLVGMVVKDAKGTQLADKLTPVEGGTGTFAGEVEFKVPPTERLTLILPLYVKGEDKSAASTTREFPVRAK